MILTLLIGAALAAAPAPPRPNAPIIFKAAGFTPTAGKYLMCDRAASTARALEVRDMNGDGRLDAIVTEGGLECYGITDSRLRAPDQSPAGKWTQDLPTARGFPISSRPAPTAGPSSRSAAPASASPCCAGPARPLPIIASNMKASPAGARSRCSPVQRRDEQPREAGDGEPDPRADEDVGQKMVAARQLCRADRDRGRRERAQGARIIGGDRAGDRDDPRAMPRRHRAQPPVAAVALLQPIGLFVQRPRTRAVDTALARQLGDRRQRMRGEHPQSGAAKPVVPADQPGGDHPERDGDKRRLVAELGEAPHPAAGRHRPCSATPCA